MRRRNVIAAVIVLVFTAGFLGLFLSKPQHYTEFSVRTIDRQIRKQGLHFSSPDGTVYRVRGKLGTYMNLRQKTFKRAYEFNGRTWYTVHMRARVREGEKRLVLDGVLRYYYDPEDPRIFVLEEWIPLNVPYQRGYWEK